MWNLSQKAMPRMNERPDMTTKVVREEMPVHDVLAAILEIDILLPPREYLAQLLRAICDHLHFAFGIAVEVSPEGMATLFAAHQLPEGFPDVARLETPTSLADALKRARNDHGIAVIYPQDTSLWHTGEGGYDIQAVVRVPLLNQERMFGYCDLFDTRQRQITDQEKHLLAQIGEMAAVAVVSNHFLEQLNQRTRELQSEIVQRKRMETALRQALRERKELEEIINISPVVAFLCKASDDCAFEFVSRSIEQFGYGQDDLLNGSVTLTNLIHPDDRAQVFEQLRQHLEEGSYRFSLEYRVLTRDGQPRWVDNQIWVRRDSDGYDLLRVVTRPRGVATHLQGILLDITERKQAEETVRHQAYHDSLTDLPNRLLFHDRLMLAMAHARRYRHMLAVVFIDLDRFKLINDTLGHAVGDLLLQAVAQRLTNRLREGDTVSRFGGDEFTVLLPEIHTADDAANAARKILDALREPFVLEGRELHVSGSLGVSLYPADGTDPDTLMQNADAALYHSKEHGRNTFQFYTTRMNEHSLQRIAWETHLHHALDRGEFLLYYQPQVEIATQQVTGVEALLRWQHAEHGLVLPEQFLPLAEDTGLIEKVGMWALRTACQQLVAWQRQGLPCMRVAVNLSARQFFQPDLVPLVREALAETGLEPERLELEITESAAMRNVDFSVEVMRQLREMGVRLALDDFGVGYSSLIYLKKFPIHTLKLDESFLGNLTVDTNDQAIASAIIAMARSLGLVVVAEGVETEEQLAFLRGVRCDRMQGFLYSPPQAESAIGQLLRFLVDE
jgi:diguanylate cyclase (GGDEF)-like protein/PAS domain S-box-containing protein